MAIYDPVELAGLVSAPSVVKSAIALAPGGVVSGVTAIVSPGLVTGAAPLFAIGTLGLAAVIMGFFVRADRR